MKERKTIRFEDTILKDVDAFAGKHRLKDQDGAYDFSNAIHTRYMELLQKERDFDQATADLQTWKNYAKTQEQTEKGFCDLLKMTVLPHECAACAAKNIRTDCPKSRPGGSA